MNKYNVIVIGSGTSGYNVVKTCREAGLSVAVVEQGTPGGVCALHGCQPKKFFVVQAEWARLGQHLQGKGIAAAPVLDWSATAAFKSEFTDAVPGNTEAYFDKVGASYHRGTARFTGPGVITVGEVELHADNIVLATGATPRRLDIPGSDLGLDSNDFLAQSELPESMIFIGGGYISFEFAHVAAAYGSRVTILNKSDRVLRQFDDELVDATVAATREAGIEVLTGHMPVEMTRTDKGVQVRCENGETLEAAAVFVTAGRTANLGSLNLEALDLAPDPRGLTVDKKMQVEGQPGLYAVGDCARTMALAPVADREALVAATNIVGSALDMDYTTVPSVCFTEPPLAAVGLTESQAQAQGLSFKVRRGKTTGWPNQRRLGAQAGQYKLLTDDEGLVIGAHLFGHGAGDSINLFALAMKNKLPAEVFKEMMWAYPTLTSDTKYMV